VALRVEPLPGGAAGAAGVVSGWARTAAEVRMWCGLADAPVPAAQIAAWAGEDGVQPFGLYRDGPLAGYGELWVDDAEAEVELARLIVDPRERGQGLGRYLVALVHPGPVAAPAAAGRHTARTGQTGLALGPGRLRGWRWPGWPRPDGSDVDAGTARTDAQAAFRQELRSFTKAHGTSQAVRALLDDPAGYDPAVWDLMAKQLGLPGLIVGEEHGGSGAGVAEAVIALEELGAVLLPSPFLPGLLGTMAVLAAGGDAAARILPAAAAGQQRLTLAGAEGTDSAAGTGGVTAAAGDGGWRLTGQVPCVLDGAGASLILVVATADTGPALFAVPAGAPGLTTVALETLDLTRREARLSFDGTPAELASDPAEAGWLPRASGLAALAVAAGSLGGIRRCLEMATGYAKERTAFGRTIGSFQAVKHMCADMLVDLECTRAAVEHAAKVADQAGEEGPPGEAAAAGLPAACSVAKAYASDAFVRAATTLIQVHGGLGFTWEHDAHLFYRRAFSDEMLFGDAAAHRAQLATALVVPA
jgi:alkylation response protein AidB-like acyl-CoA dehydrogenase